MKSRGVKKYKEKQIENILLEKFKNNTAITLIAIVVTIVVLIILALITMTFLIGENGIITKAMQAKEKSSQAEAREKLELVLLDAQTKKETNSEYDENKWLDHHITDNIEGSLIVKNIDGDIVIVDGWEFELDRSVPKIGRELGKMEELVPPEITLSKSISGDNKIATIIMNVTADRMNPIRKIEVIQDESVLYTFNYDDRTQEVVQETYEVRYNGTYKVKVYTNLSTIEEITIDELKVSIVFSPNGNSTYKKTQSTSITINGQSENVKSLKYIWTSNTSTPSIASFTASCNIGGTLSKAGTSGLWYLWILVENSAGKQSIERSGAFALDNENPVLNTFTATATSATAIKLSATAQDTKSGVTKIEFFVDNKSKGSQTYTASTASRTKTLTVTGLTTGSHTCKVVVSDLAGNSINRSINEKTKQYTWRRYNVASTTVYKEVSKGTKQVTVCSGATANGTIVLTWSFDSKTGKYNYKSSPYGSRWYDFFSGGKNAISGTTRYKSNGYRYGCNNKITGNIETFQIESSTTTSKGSTEYPEVTSNSSTAYPTNGASGSYWYVYKGTY